MNARARFEERKDMCISVDEMTIRELENEVDGLKHWLADPNLSYMRATYYKSRLAHLEPYLEERKAKEAATEAELKAQEQAINA